MSGAPDLVAVPYKQFVADVTSLADQLAARDWRPAFIVGIGRGGLAPALWLSHASGVPMLSVDLSSGVPAFSDDLLDRIATRAAAGERFLLVDDINDSGRTIATVRARLAAGADTIRFAVLIDNSASPERPDLVARAIDRRVDKSWYVFPWEALAARAILVADAAAVPERLG